MRMFLLGLMCVVTLSCFALPPSKCAQAELTTASGFCSSFKEVAACHCRENDLPAFACDSMTFLYNAMLARYHRSLELACASQTDTSPQNCIDDWNCYRLGGYNSKGGLCSGNGGSC